MFLRCFGCGKSSIKGVGEVRPNSTFAGNMEKGMGVRWSMGVAIALLILTACGANDKETKAQRFWLKGNEQLDERNFAKAIDYYDEAIMLDPNFTAAYTNRGIAQFEMAAYPQAIQSHTMAINLAPDQSETWYNRGHAFLMYGQYENALVDWDSLERRDPGFLQVDFLRGLALAELDD
ncbi:MAG TPA: hypothetical protein DCP28_19745, partial [Cytophagales bacterium]|nr:hypothetical protein [Cytophagales bacterium]